MPIIMQHNKTTIGLLADAANSNFHYPRYFSMISSGPEPKRSFSIGFFELAAAQKPQAADRGDHRRRCRIARNATDGARENAAKDGLKIVYDQSYPPTTTDFAPILRAVQATNPDLVYVASYPPDSGRHHPLRQRDRARHQDVRRRHGRARRSPRRRCSSGRC